jgi:hypothetical protein
MECLNCFSTSPCDPFFLVLKMWKYLRMEIFHLLKVHHLVLSPCPMLAVSWERNVVDGKISIKAKETKKRWTRK